LHFVSVAHACGENVNRESKSTAVPLLAGLAILAIPLLVYMTGYFLLCESENHYGRARMTEPERLIAVERIYPREWMVSVFRPAAWVENKVRRILVEVGLKRETYAPHRGGVCDVFVESTL
jgi:hypothetical protein